MNPVAPKMVTSVLRAAAMFPAAKRKIDLGQITAIKKTAAVRATGSPTDKIAKLGNVWTVFLAL